MIRPFPGAPWNKLDGNVNRLFHNCPFLYLVISSESCSSQGSGAGSSLTWEYDFVTLDMKQQ